MGRCRTGFSFWRTANRQLLRWGSALHRTPSPPAIAAAARRRRHDMAGARRGQGTLYVANGRLGDTLLAAAFTGRYRRWLPTPVVAVCRPEAAVVLRDQVDELHTADGSDAALNAAWQALQDRRFQVALGDLHLFHGGEALTELLDAVGADRRFASAGYADANAIAPARRLPRRALVVGMRRKPAAGTDPDALHVFGDLLHYHAAVLRQLGLMAAWNALPDRPELPAALLDGAIATRFQLKAGDYVACQPGSSQTKKDWPWRRWLELFEVLRDMPFVLLGKAPAADQQAPIRGPVIDLRGRTSLRDAIALSASATAFVGVDSGLAHAAAMAGVPTVVAMPAATTGFFFPYPTGCRQHDIHAVTAPAFASCAGCRGLCRHEPLWHSRRHGFPCIRGLEVGVVAAQLRAALATAAARRRPEPVAAHEVGA